MSITEFTKIGYAMSISDPELSTQQIVKWHNINRLITAWCDQEILLDGIPIKSSTISDKIHKITNLSECTDAFNDWARSQPIATAPVTLSWLNCLSEQDRDLYSL